jgi:hypothetical protein
MTLREALQAVYDKHNKLTPDLVVEEARQNSSEAGKILHSRLEWDNEKAGEAWRREQASQLIRVAYATYKNEEGENKKIRAFHSVPSEKGHVYEPLEKIKTDEFTRNLVLQQMEREWRAMYDRYRDFAEFVEMIKKDLGS